MSPLDYAKQIAYSTIETLEFTYHQAIRFKDTQGVYVECGVAAGAQIIAMAHGAPNKTVYAFDSFQGICLPSNRDDQMPGIKLLTKQEQGALPNPGDQVLETTGATAVNMADFLNHIKASGIDGSMVIAVAGWFEDILPKFLTAIEPGLKTFPNAFDIAILRLDGDLYNSTWVCLQHLFPKVIKGGCVIVDDWQLPGCRAACDEYFALIGYEPDYKFISNIAYFYK